MQRLKDIKSVLILLIIVILGIIFLPVTEKEGAAYTFSNSGDINRLFSGEEGSLGSTFNLTESQLKSSANKNFYCIATSTAGHGTLNIETYIEIEGTKATIYRNTTSGIKTATYDSKDNARLVYLLGGGTYPTGYGNSGASRDITLRQVALWRNLPNTASNEQFGTPFSIFTKNHSNGVGVLYNNSWINYAGYSNEKWNDDGSTLTNEMNNYSNNIASISTDVTSRNSFLIDENGIYHGSSGDVNLGSSYSNKELINYMNFEYTGDLSLTVKATDGSTISTSNLRFYLPSYSTSVISYTTFINNYKSGADFHLINMTNKNVASITANVSGNNNILKAKLFLLTDSNNKQPVMAAQVEETPATKSVTINVSGSTGSIKITKRDADNNSTLQGAEFRIYEIGHGWVGGSANNYEYNIPVDDYQEAAIFTTNSNGEVNISGLRLGQYRIFESKAPDGYTLQEIEDYEFYSNREYGLKIADVEVGSRGVTVEQTVYNKKDCKITVVKKDSDTGEALAGAGFKVYVQNHGYLAGNAGGPYTYDNTVDNATIYYTNSNGQLELTNLGAYRYIVCEVEAPDGYILEEQDGYHTMTPTTGKGAISAVTAIADFTEDSSSAEISINMTNKATNGLTIVKLDEITQNPLQDVGFKIYVQGEGYLSGTEGGPYTYNNTVENATVYFTNENGRISLENLKKAVYVIWEIQTANGYDITKQEGYHTETTTSPQNGTISGISQTVDFTSDTTAEVEFTNMKYGKITIIKNDENSGEALSGVGFKIYAEGQGYLAGNAGGPYTYDNTADNATTYYTNSEGRIELENLAGYEYIICEVEAPDGYNLSEQEGYTTFTPNTGKGSVNGVIHTLNFIENSSTNELVLNVTNTVDGGIQIVKVDADTNSPLEGVGFKIYAEGQGYLAGSVGGPYTYTNTVDNATVYYTDSDGRINLTNLRNYTYQVWEVETIEGYDITKQEGYHTETTTSPQRGTISGVSQTADINSSPSVSLTLTNKRICNLNIIKTDRESGERLVGAGFIIYAEGQGYLAGNAGGPYTYTNTVDNATTYYTDSNGRLELSNLANYNYNVFEVEAPDGYNLSEQEGYTTFNPDTGKGSITGVMHTIKFTEDNTNNELEVNVTNTANGEINIIKRDKDTNVVLQGVGFKIYAEGQGYLSGNLGGPYTYTNTVDNATIYRTDANGRIELTNLRNYTYQVWEVEAIEGYDITKQEGYHTETTTSPQNGTISGVSQVLNLNSTNSIEITFENEALINISGYVWVDIPQAKDNGYNSLYDTDGSERRVANVTVNLINKETGRIISTTTTNQNGEYTFENVSKNDLGNLYVQFNYSNTEYKSYIPVAFNNTNAQGSRALYDEVAEYDRDLSGIVSTYKGTSQEATYGLSGTLYDNFYNSSNNTLENINLGIKELPVTEYTIQENIVEAVISLGDIDYTYEYGGRGTIISDTVPTVNWKDGIAYSADIYPSDISYAIRESQSIEATVTYRVDITNTTNLSIEELYVEQKLHIRELINTFDTNRYELSDSNWTASGGTATITNSYLNEIYGDGLSPNETGTAYITFSIRPNAITDILNNPDGISEESPTRARATAYHEYTRRDYSWNNNLTQTQTHYTNDQEREDDAQYLVFQLGKQRATTGTVFEDNSVATNGEIVGNGRYDDGESKISGIKVELLNESGDVAKLYGANASVISEDVSGKTYEDMASTTTDDNGNYSFVGIIPGNYYLRFTYGDGTEQISEYKSTVVTSTVVQNAIEDDSNSNRTWYKDIEGNNYSVAIDNLDMREAYNADNSSVTQMQANTALMEIETDCSDETITQVNGTECYEFNVFNFGIIRLPDQRLTLDKVITNVTLTNTQGNVLLSGNPTVDVIAGVTTQELEPGGNGAGFVRIELPEENIYGSRLTLTYEVIITNESDLNFYEDRGTEHYGWYYKYGYKDDNTKEVTITANEVLDYLDPALTYVSSDPEGMVEELTNNGGWKDEDGNSVSNSDEINELVALQEQYMQDEHTREEDYESVLSITGWEELHSTQTEINGAQTSDVVEITAERVLSAEDEDTETISTAEIITAEPSPEPLIPTIVDLPEREDATTQITPPTGANMQNIVIYSLIGIVALITVGIGIVLIKKKVL